ncbi:sensor histidine kinase [Halobaculum sp. MBLA0147]|uniref:sensor histidine kinase n=1 Tax=Halobaculum sp. MBLA0147 TaxID=3079934 RepID=UPI00352679E9
MTTGTRLAPGRRLISPRVFTAVGVATGLYCLYALATATVSTRGGVPEVAWEVALLGVPAVGHAVTGYWLETAGLDDEVVWRIGVVAATGAVVGVTTTLVVLPLVIGDATLDTGLFLLVATGTEGALLGALGAAVWLPAVPLGRRGPPSVTVGDGSGTDHRTTGATRDESAPPRLPTPDSARTEPVDSARTEPVDPARLGTEHGVAEEPPTATEEATRRVGSPAGDEPVTPDETVERLRTLHSLVRHDVRNSVNVLSGRLDLLLDELEVDDDPHLAAIDRQTDEILTLLADVEVAVEAVTADRSREPVSVSRVVDEAVAALDDSYRGVEVSVSVPETAVVRADELLSNVVENVLSNAVRHHDRDTVAIDVTATLDDHTVTLVVTDDGPGIPDRLLPEVLNPEVGEGSGMGLYLVDTLVDDYGGSVSVASPGERGTTVEIELPRATEPSDEVAA